MPRRAPLRATLASPIRAAVTLGALLATTVASSRAQAKVSVQGTGLATAGWSDNILNAPNDPVTNGPTRESDFLFQLSPGVVLTSAAPRLLQSVTYNFAATLYARHSEANSYTNTLGWVGNVFSSPTTSLILKAESQQGKVSTFNLNQSSSGATVAVLPQNSNIRFFSQSVSESLEATPRAKWRVSQKLGFRLFAPIDRGTLPDSYNLAGDLGLDRIFTLDALGLLLHVELVDFVVPRDPTTNVAVGFDQRQVITSLVGRWRRDWSRSWSSEAALGVLALVGATSDPTTPTLTAWEPSALAALRYATELGGGELRYAHDVAPNTLSGSTYSTDQVALQAGMPIVRAKLFFGATVAYQHARRVSLIAGMPGDSANLALVDLTVGWKPIPELGVFARYSYLDQIGNPPVNNVPSLLPNLTHNLVLVGVNVIYPAVAAARVSSQPASRVDRSDQAAVPELHAAQPR